MTIWHPNPNQVERLRLLLSTYQDGTGMLIIQKRSLPGWRDFERSVALAFGGRAAESKAIFDVVLPNGENPGTFVGLSCKMRSELGRVARDGRVTIEVSNSAGEFWDYLNTLDINQTNYRDYPAQVGAGLLHVVAQWHLAPSTERGGLVELARSSYLVLQWNRTGTYQLFQYAVSLPDPASLRWSFPLPKRGDRAGRRIIGEAATGLLPKRGDRDGRRIIGEAATGLLFEWYGESGGQLKYYPFAADAIWSSAPFRLEPLPTTMEYGILVKAAAYFPEKWAQASEE
jgi:hypothetical protein